MDEWMDRGWKVGREEEREREGEEDTGREREWKEREIQRETETDREMGQQNKMLAHHKCPTQMQV